jgi:hypothetical protein
MRRLLLALFLTCGLAACGEDSNRLYGSMSQVYTLSFDRVRIIRISDQVTVTSNQVAVEYLRNSDQAKVAKLTVIVGGLANMAGNEIDLTEMVEGLPRGTVQRIEKVTTDFPLQVGNVRFNQEPVAGTNLSGSFHTTLSDPAGRTLNGEFDAKVEAP